MSTKNLLVELLVEEMPPKSLKILGESFAAGLYNGLSERGFVSDSAKPTGFATPRRLGVWIPDVLSTAADTKRSEEIMLTAIAFDSEQKPTAPLIKRLQKMFHDGIDVADLLTSGDFVKKVRGGKEYLYRDVMVQGGNLLSGLEGALEDALERLPIAKVMTYPDPSENSLKTVKFVRPVHGLVALHGNDIVKVNALGLIAGRDTQGHRFEANAAKVKLNNADSYESQLEKEGAVIPSFEIRRDEILKQISATAAREKLTPVGDEDLLNEVTALVERPNVLVGTFEKEFLEVPQECLILTMQANQKYFPLLDANGKLTNKFLIVSNIRPADPSFVIGGNERVVRPRLADAKFFYDQDRKKTLESRVPGLAKVVYHNKLGTQSERSEKVEMIAVTIAAELDGKNLESHAGMAAKLAKADLLTDMVGEFPELQGIMGRYYALHEGLPSEVADAIEDHYKPRFAGDDIPRGDVGLVLALADKLETLVGLFGIGQIPTGDKDPFALRRHALGVVRILMERDLPLHLDALLFLATGVRGFPESVGEQVASFMYERLSGLLREQGYSTIEVDAVVSLRPQRLGDIPKRLEAVRAFAKLGESPALAAANKRVGNILKKSEDTIESEVNQGLLNETAEKALHLAINTVVPKANSSFERGDYTASLQELAKLKEPVDAFFDHVMVNVEDKKLRSNRLALLAQLHRAMNRIADISKLAS